MQTNAIFSAYNAMAHVEPLLTDILIQFELTVRQWTILNLLKNKQHTLTLLQENLRTNKSTLSRQLSQLTRKRLIAYKKTPDSRQRYYQLTQTGMQALLQANQALSDIDTAVLQYWSPEEIHLFLQQLNRFARDVNTRGTKALQKG